MSIPGTPDYKAESIYNAMRVHGKDHTITMLHLEMKITVLVAELIFTQLENGDPIDTSPTAIEAYKDK